MIVKAVPKAATGISQELKSKERRRTFKVRIVEVLNVPPMDQEGLGTHFEFCIDHQYMNDKFDRCCQSLKKLRSFSAISIA